MPVSGMKYASGVRPIGPYRSGGRRSRPCGHGRQKDFRAEQDQRGGMHLSPLFGGFRDADATLSITADP